jgi:biopolymer transport protein ExbD
MQVGSGGGGGDPEVMIDINTTPLIDVMLVLIIMLIITIPVQTHAVKLNMPVGNPPPPTTPPVVIGIEVDFDGTILWNGDIIPDRPTLESKFLAAAQQPIQPEFHLRPTSL